MSSPPKINLAPGAPKGYSGVVRRLFSWLNLCAGLALAAGLAFADPVDDLIKQELQAHQVAGIACLVIQDGRAIKTSCCGLANLEWNVPVTEDTVFEIGSVTKPFTAACILLLAQEGKLSVDDKISLHLANTPPAWADITLRHLLTHTSGLANYDDLEGFELRRHLTQEQFIHTLAAYPLGFAPGEKWSYCNSGYNLLGFIIENVSGKNYWDFLRERILQPLQMTNTTRRDPALILPPRADGYEMTNHLRVHRDSDLTDLFSGGAMVSTVTDLAKWDAALNGNSLLKESSKQQAWTPARLNHGETQDYGLGWRLAPFQGRRNIGHSGSTSGFSASFQRFPDDHLTVILLSNGGELNFATDLARKVAALYFPEKPAPH